MVKYEAGDADGFNSMPNPLSSCCPCSLYLGGYRGEGGIMTAVVEKFWYEMGESEKEKVDDMLGLGSVATE